MKRLNKRMTAGAMLVVILLSLVTPIWGQSAATRFSRLIVNNTLSVVGTSTLTGAVTTGGSVTVGDDATVTDDLNVTDDAIFASDISASPQTTLTLTMNGWITPTGTLQLVSSAGAVSVSGGRIAPGTAGDVLVLLNVGSQTITISETTGLISAGNISLGTLDSATLVWRLASWYQISGSNN